MAPWLDFVLALMEDKIVAYATSNEAFLYSRQCIDSVIYVSGLLWSVMRFGHTSGLMHDGRLQCSQALRLRPCIPYILAEASSKVRDVTFEIGHGNYLLGLSQNAFFRAANDKLALMGRDGAEGATAEASRGC